MMESTTELQVLKNDISLVPLQNLYNQNPVTFENIKVLQRFLEIFRDIINRFHKQDNNKWAALFGIGLKELDDHMEILMEGSGVSSQNRSYNDFHNYLSASVQDAIDTVSI